MSITKEQAATNHETWKHIHRISVLLHKVANELLLRSESHDQSKLCDPEVQTFTECTKKLATCTYGSDEYNGFLKEMAPALEHHYANNRHHPEHFKNGINDMNIIDIVEMICDWKAASERHNDGNIRKSIEINANRFGLSPQLVKILENTSDLLFAK